MEQTFWNFLKPCVVSSQQNGKSQLLWITFIWVLRRQSMWPKSLHRNDEPLVWVVIMANSRAILFLKKSTEVHECSNTHTIKFLATLIFDWQYTFDVLFWQARMLRKCFYRAIAFWVIFNKGYFKLKLSQDMRIACVQHVKFIKFS